jgi:hypothetical protein
VCTTRVVRRRVVAQRKQAFYAVGTSRMSGLVYEIGRALEQFMRVAGESEAWRESGPVTGKMAQGLR